MTEMEGFEKRLAALEAKVNGRDSPTPTTTPPQSANSPAARPARLQITNSPPTPQSSAFFRLSTELRLEIYRFVVPEEKYIDVDSSGYARPALFSTCKEIYFEALSSFYADYFFCADTQDFDPALITRWCQETKHLQNAPQIMARSTWNPHWKNLVEWIKAYHARHLREQVYSLGNLSRSQQHQVRSLFRTAFVLRKHSWDLMEGILGGTRPVLIGLDSRWGHDH